jgi:hypothetical protein
MDESLDPETPLTAEQVERLTAPNAFQQLSAEEMNAFLHETVAQIAEMPDPDPEEDPERYQQWLKLQLMMGRVPLDR